jgi:hypothetical protein
VPLMEKHFGMSLDEVNGQVSEREQAAATA